MAAWLKNDYEIVVSGACDYGGGPSPLGSVWPATEEGGSPPSQARSLSVHLVHLSILNCIDSPFQPAHYVTVLLWLHSYTTQDVG
ncbi:hypothetical protein KIN20_000687 [Parelaphostrongylus tenuis]|uniref:Uncharacterized protein n=1 Tax=Parelaphostrongylus tenuis TaxID=148309 RepID=A0AAD5ME14_PARTN|nr:hypothetical protein KIN20_000687 [Parelaphostrongylus tenuis]